MSSKFVPGFEIASGKNRPRNDASLRARGEADGRSNLDLEKTAHKFCERPTNYQPREGKEIRGYFDAIAARYDFLNQTLSFRLDEGWRNRTRDLVLEGCEESLLDLGMGTGKLTETFRKVKPWKRIVGLDFSAGMLAQVKKDSRAQGEFLCADFQNLPFQTASFDLVVSSFTLRSVRNIGEFLEGVWRVLNPGGKAAFLCLTRPENPFWRALVWPYLKFYLPFVGGLISGNRKAYEFLSSSILTFQEPITTARMMKAAGFKDVKIHRFTLGLATLIMGKK